MPRGALNFDVMNPVVLVLLALIAATLPPETLRSILATAASTLFESIPFILAGALLARAPLRWSGHLLPYLGCGCAAGCSARSLPAAAATAIAFGPIVAIARVAAATLAERAIYRNGGCNRAENDSPLSQLATIVPFATLGGAISPAAGWLGHTGGPIPAAVGGALLAFVLAPCALGAVGMASALRTVSPSAAFGFLCVAGIIDARAFLRAPRVTPSHDVIGYALAAVAVAIVAWHHGSALVHPRFTWALWASAAGLATCAVARGSMGPARARFAPVLMLAAAVMGAPQPAYRASETTLGDAFAGERVDFTGVLAHNGGASALVRYAITCCRADAMPVVARLQRTPAEPPGTWLRAQGTLVDSNHALVLRTDRIERVATPADPYVYR